MGFNPTWDQFWDFFEQLDNEQKDFMEKGLNELIQQAPNKVKEEILKNAPSEFKFHGRGSGELSPLMREIINQKLIPLSASEQKKIDDLLARAKKREKNTASRYVRNEQRYVMRRGMYSLFRSFFGGRF